MITFAIFIFIFVLLYFYLFHENRASKKLLENYSVFCAWNNISLAGDKPVPGVKTKPQMKSTDSELISEHALLNENWLSSKQEVHRQILFSKMNKKTWHFKKFN